MGLFKRKPKEAKLEIGGEYFGTHPGIPGYHRSLRLAMVAAGIDVSIGDKSGLGDNSPIAHFSWDEVIRFETGVERETQGGGQRLTATRMMTLGVFSLAAPKATGKTTTSFKNVFVTTTGEIVLEIELEGSAGSGVRSMADGFIKKHGQQARVFVAQHALGKEMVK